MKTKTTTAEDAIFNDTDVMNAEETAELVPVNAVESNEREKETEISASPVVIPREKLHAIENTLQQLETMEAGIALNAKYREFNATGEIVRGVYIGTKTVFKKDKGEMKPIECMSWIDAEKQVWISGAKILVSQCSMLPQGTPIEIVYREQIKMELGYAKSFDVKPLY